MCSGSNTSATIASVNAQSNQLHHLSYDNAAYAGLDISTACHPPSLLEEYNFNPNIHGWKRPRGRPKTRWADSIKHDLNSAGLDTTNAAQMVFDRPQWKAFVIADCLRSNPSKARKQVTLWGIPTFKSHLSFLPFNIFNNLYSFANQPFCSSRIFFLICHKCCVGPIW